MGAGTSLACRPVSRQSCRCHAVASTAPLGAQSLAGGAERCSLRCVKRNHVKQASSARCFDVMWCPDCNQDLTNVEIDNPCPQCGGQRRLDAVGPQTAHALAVAAPMRVVTQERDEDENAERISVGSESFRSTSERSGDNVDQFFRGVPPRGEQDVLQVCRTLRYALKGVGEEWERFRSMPQGDDADAVSMNAQGHELRVQVTAVERRAWRELGRNGTTRSQRSVVDLVEDIHDAIAAKAAKHAPAQRRALVLALDAQRSPAHSQAVVADLFRAERGDWARSLGYHAIWLIGPTVPMSARLDGDE